MGAWQSLDLAADRNVCAPGHNPLEKTAPDSPLAYCLLHERRDLLGSAKRIIVGSNIMKTN